MGSSIEINDTLKLKRGRGFPKKVRLGETCEFVIPGRRLYHLKPIRVFLVEEIDGQWNFVGHVMILELTIDAVREETRGVFQVSLLYPPEHVKLANKFDAPPGKGYLVGGKPEPERGKQRRAGRAHTVASK